MRVGILLLFACLLACPAEAGEFVRRDDGDRAWRDRDSSGYGRGRGDDRDWRHGRPRSDARGSDRRRDFDRTRERHGHDRRERPAVAVDLWGADLFQSLEPSALFVPVPRPPLRPDGRPDLLRDPGLIPPATVNALTSRTSVDGR